MNVIGKWEPPPPECKTCGGSGNDFYDHNHSRPCRDCCTHDHGWWMLNHEGHGDLSGLMACHRCGTTRPPTLGER